MNQKTLVFLVLGGLGLLILTKPAWLGFAAPVPAEPNPVTDVPTSFPLFTLQGSGANKTTTGLATVDWLLGKDGVFSSDVSPGAAVGALASDILKISNGQPIVTPAIQPQAQNVPNFEPSGARTVIPFPRSLVA